MLNVRMFGPGQAMFQGKRLTGFPERRSGQLLAYLVLHRGAPLRRERVASVFWRGYPTSRSRKYLRDALWRLRKDLRSLGAEPDDYLAVSDNSISFSPTNEVKLDLDQFEASVQPTLDVAGDQLSGEQAQALAGAVDCYQGDLLQGTFQDWCLNDRERLRLQYLGALEKLTIFHERHGHIDRAIRYARLLLEQDETREDITRRLMRLHWARGDRSGALEQYALLESVLRETFGVRPAPPTRELHRKIRAGTPETMGVKDVVTSMPARSQADEIPPEQALTKLRQLRRALSRTNHELRKLEKSFKLALSETSQQ